MRTHLTALAALTALIIASSLAGCSAQEDGRDVSSASAVNASPGRFGQAAPESRLATPAPETHCSPAPALMRNALCVCGSLEHAGSLTTEGRTAGQAANVGIEGHFHGATGSRIGGTLRAVEGVSTAGELRIAGNLFSRASVETTGTLAVEGDLAAGGDMLGVGTVDVHGTLRVAGETTLVGPHTIAARGAYGDTGASICGCDAPYDVAGAVKIARTTNDNAARGIQADGHPRVGETELALPAGRYYVAGLTSVGVRHLKIDGAVQLYVDGDLEHVGDDVFELAPGATLDLFVAGNVRTVGSVRLGDASRPEAFRLYVGGAGRIEITGTAELAGLVYAPTADVDMAGTAVIEGGLTAHSISYAGDLTVRYSPVTAQGEKCEEKSVPAPPTTGNDLR